MQNKSARQDLPPQHFVYTSIKNSQKQPIGWSVSSVKKSASIEFLWLTQAMIRVSKKTKCVCTSYFVANHDITYDVNKTRAQSLASSTNTGILYCAAKDHPTLDALRARPDLPTQNMEWLNRHDRESGDLYGVLPLMKGMPVVMTDHIDRSIDQRILKGRVGHVHSWVLDKDETSTFKNGKRM